jgi:hypothetical protein
MKLSSTISIELAGKQRPAAIISAVGRVPFQDVLHGRLKKERLMMACGLL